MIWKYREQLTLAAAALLVGVGFYGVPSWRGALHDVCHQAAIFGIVTIAVLFATRWFGPRCIAVERAWSALLLAGMPLVYVAAWLTAGGGGTGGARLAVEVAGFPIYGAMAWLGLRRRWPWLLVAGISAHGIAWDAWHWAVESAYIPSWYVTGCLLADVGISLYLATRVATWRRASPAARAATARETIWSA